MSHISGYECCGIYINITNYIRRRRDNGGINVNDRLVKIKRNIVEKQIYITALTCVYDYYYYRLSIGCQISSTSK